MQSLHIMILCHILLYIVHKSGVLMLVLVGFKILCSYILVIIHKNLLVHLFSCEDHNGGITAILLICY